MGYHLTQKNPICLVRELVNQDQNKNENGEKNRSSSSFWEICIDIHDARFLSTESGNPEETEKLYFRGGSEANLVDVIEKCKHLQILRKNA